MTLIIADFAPLTLQQILLHLVENAINVDSETRRQCISYLNTTGTTEIDAYLNHSSSSSVPLIFGELEQEFGLLISTNSIDTAAYDAGHYPQSGGARALISELARNETDSPWRNVSGREEEEEEAATTIALSPKLSSQQRRVLIRCLLGERANETSSITDYLDSRKPFREHPQAQEALRDTYQITFSTHGDTTSITVPSHQAEVVRTYLEELKAKQAKRQGVKITNQPTSDLLTLAAHHQAENQARILAEDAEFTRSVSGSFTKVMEQFVVTPGYGNRSLIFSQLTMLCEGTFGIELPDDRTTQVHTETISGFTITDTGATATSTAKNSTTLTLTLTLETTSAVKKITLELGPMDLTQALQKAPKGSPTEKAGFDYIFNTQAFEAITDKVVTEYKAATNYTGTFYVGKMPKLRQPRPAHVEETPTPGRTTLTAVDLRKAIDDAARKYLKYNKENRHGFLYDNHGAKGVNRVTQLLADCMDVPVAPVITTTIASTAPARRRSIDDEGEEKKQDFSIAGASKTQILSDVEPYTIGDGARQTSFSDPTPQTPEDELAQLRQALEACFTGVSGGTNNHSFTTFLMVELKGFDVVTALGTTQQLYSNTKYHGGLGGTSHQAEIKAFKRAFDAPTLQRQHADKPEGDKLLTAIALKEAIDSAIKEYTDRRGGVVNRRIQQLVRDINAPEKRDEISDLSESLAAYMHSGQRFNRVGTGNYSFVSFLMNALKGYNLEAQGFSTNLQPLEDYTLDHGQAVKAFVAGFARPSDTYKATPAPAPRVVAPPASGVDSASRVFSRSRSAEGQKPLDEKRLEMSPSPDRK